MGQGKSMPVLHPERQAADGLSAISDPFEGSDLVDDYDEFTESLLRVLKAPISAHLPVHYKDTVVNENDADNSFEVYIRLDAKRAPEAPTPDIAHKKDRIIEHKKHHFDYGGRTLVSISYKDHWDGDTPETMMETCTSFGIPLCLEAYVAIGGQRYANAGVAATLQPLLDAVEFDVQICRLPETKLHWRPEMACYQTGLLGTYTEYNVLFENMIKAVHKSVIPSETTLPSNMRMAPKSADHMIIIRNVSGTCDTIVLEMKCVADTIESHITRTYSTHAMPSIRFEFTKSPLSIDVFLLGLDGASYSEYHHRGQEQAQVIIDEAFNLAQLGNEGGAGVTSYVSTIGACCAARGTECIA